MAEVAERDLGAEMHQTHNVRVNPRTNEAEIIGKMDYFRISGKSMPTLYIHDGKFKTAAGEPFEVELFPGGLEGIVKHLRETKADFSALAAAGYTLPPEGQLTTKANEKITPPGERKKIGYKCPVPACNEFVPLKSWGTHKMNHVTRKTEWSTAYDAGDHSVYEDGKEGS